MSMTKRRVSPRRFFVCNLLAFGPVSRNHQTAIYVLLCARFPEFLNAHRTCTITVGKVSRP